MSPGSISRSGLHPVAAAVAAVGLGSALLWALLPNVHNDEAAASAAIPRSLHWSVSGMTRTQFEDGIPVLTVRAERARLAAAKLGPFRFMPASELEAEQLDVTLHLPEGKAVAVSQPADLATALALGSTRGGRVATIRAQGFRLAFVAADDQLECEMHADTALWSAWPTSTHGLLQLRGRVSVRSRHGVLHCERLELDPQTRRVRAEGAVVLNTDAGSTTYDRFEAPCNLHLEAGATATTERS